MYCLVLVHVYFVYYCFCVSSEAGGLNLQKASSGRETSVPNTLAQLTVPSQGHDGGNCNTNGTTCMITAAVHTVNCQARPYHARCPPWMLEHVTPLGPLELPWSCLGELQENGASSSAELEGPWMTVYKGV